jgi:hypothetical protein
MSTNQPPTGPPPSGPPSASPPPASAEVLEQGGGGPLPPAAPPTGAGGGRRKGLIIGGVIGVLALGGAAFGAYSWLTSTGPQPAEALPADTLGYVSIDLDPSGSQKIAALKTLEKFPAADEWLDEEGIGSGDDIRKFVFGKIQEEEGACEDLDFDDDIKPWLGDRFAVAAIDGGDAEFPVPVGVVQVKDGDEAQDRVEQVIEACGGDPDDGGLAVNGDWLIIAETDEVAEQVADDAAEASLADDEEFQKWTEAAGDPGIVTAYASAEAGKVLGEELGSFGGALGSGGATDCSTPDDLTEGCLSYEEDGLEEEIVPDDAAKALEDFEGMALTVRFDDGSLEVEVASGMKDLGLNSLSSDAAGEAISTLPEDTAAAIGLGFEPGWAEELLDYVGSMSGTGADIEGFLDEAESTFDLSLPEDLETLFGESAAIAVGSDFDPEAFFGSASGASDLPIGAKVKGDTEAIQEVIDKVKATAPSPEEAEIFSTESDDDYIVIGPDSDYLSELLDDGGLGDTDTYQDVVREDEAASIFFIDFDAGDGWLASLAGDDAEVKENLEPLAGLGLTGWQDDDETGHVVLRVTTD